MPFRSGLPFGSRGARYLCAASGSTARNRTAAWQVHAPRPVIEFSFFTFLFSCWFAGLDPDFFQDLALMRQLRRPGRKLVGAQNLRQDIGGLFAVQLTGSIGRHCGADAVEEIAGREPVPV